MSQGCSRRNFLALIGVATVDLTQSMRPGARAASTSLLTAGHANAAMGQGTEKRAEPSSAQAGILTATLSWTDPATGISARRVSEGVRVRVSRHADLSHPVVQITLAGDATSCRVVVAPSTTYYWSVVPVTGKEEAHERAAHGSFTTAAPHRDPKADDDFVRYAGVRPGAHWVTESELLVRSKTAFQPRQPVPYWTTKTEIAPASPPAPLSPWFDLKRYDGVSSPTFEEVKAAFPVPIVDGEPHLLEAYWYCWKTLMQVWLFPPSEPDHQAVANLIGLRDWGNWGSVMVWDTAFILQFARYGHHAYSYITAFDNFYARQHENGFICREADKNNRDVYSSFPLNPPLYAWAEWSSYQLTGNQERLARVLTPIVKHYEWWVRFQRRDNGLYWTDGFNEADDSPRNTLMYYAASATSYQALAALDLARMAKVVGRADLVDYFESQHASLGKMVNEHFWDEKHQLYNDLTKDGRFITELEPGVLCKHCHMFWPMLAEIAPPERVQGLVRELLNPNSFFLPTGVPSLSADSKGFDKVTGQYWKGSVWPPIQCLVQSGLKVSGKWELAQQLARKNLDAMVTVYQRQHTIYENMEPNDAVGVGHGDFVGWGGIGPIQDLIEYVLGFDVSVSTQTVTWRITRLDRHGIENLHVGPAKVDLTCASRPSPKAPCHLTITSGKRLILVVHLNGRATTRTLSAGVTQLVVG